MSLLWVTTACTSERTALYSENQGEPAQLLVYANQAREELPRPAFRGAQTISADSLSVSVSGNSAGTMLIRSARVTVQVDSLEAAITAARDTATAFGGFVAGFSRMSAGNWRPAAALTLRVPVARLDAVVQALSELGHVESVHLAAQDVGEEFVDVSARMDNARRLERRLVDLLTRRTGQLEDVLKVEEALARVREEIERIEGRRRYLQTHAALSTLELSLHEAGPAAGPRITSTAGDAVAQAWQNFTALIATGIAASGVFVPLGLVAAIGWTVVKRARRRHAPAGGTAATL